MSLRGHLFANAAIAPLNMFAALNGKIGWLVSINFACMVTSLIVMWHLGRLVADEPSEAA